MKTASIITMHCPLNYGAVLQTFGLQTYLGKQGLLVNIIDYNPYYIVNDQDWKYIGDNRFKRNFLTRWVYILIKAPHKIIRKKRFSDFMRNELNLTRKFKTYQDIVNNKLDADYFFCGSDQIWNTLSGAHLDPAYFLQFVKDEKKRNSYSASGNLPLTDEVINITIPMINQLHNISMREDVTIASIQPYINKEIIQVCDPVFLLEAEYWRALAQHGPSFSERTNSYILIYPMGNGGELVVKKGRELADKLKVPLYCITASQRKDTRIDKIFNADPYTFLHLFDNAKVVVTNSFHGTSFSIILEKEFWSCAAIGSNQRITSLLSKCGLEDRIISEFESPSEKVINYKRAKDKLNVFIDSSKAYINKIINE